MTVSDLPRSALQNSVLVVAHPDDEILWFGSIVQDVDKIVICFLDDPRAPKIGLARRKSLEEHPLRQKIECLELTETASFNKAAWPLPEISEFGVAIGKDSQVAREYEARAVELRGRLGEIVAGANNLFTHNPWGEYGHEEHIMVHRIAASVAVDSAIDVWHSNYVSTWSQELMDRHDVDSVGDFYTGNVDTAAMMDMSQCYRDNRAWTWMADYEWFPEECYFRGSSSINNAVSSGETLPLNVLNLPGRSMPNIPAKISTPRKFQRKLARFARRLKGQK